MVDYQNLQSCPISLTGVIPRQTKLKFIIHYTCGGSRKKKKWCGWIGMESTGRWSNGLGSLNPKCHYVRYEGVGWLASLFTPWICHCTCLQAIRPSRSPVVQVHAWCALGLTSILGSESIFLMQVFFKMPI